MHHSSFHLRDDSAYEAAYLLEAASTSMHAAISLLGRSVRPPFSWPPPSSPPRLEASTRIPEVGPLHDALASASTRSQPSVSYGPMITPRPPLGSGEDMLLLVQTLLEHEQRGQDPRIALRALDGKHGHTEKEWIDFYIVHAPRIHGLSTQAHKPDREVESKPQLEQAGRKGSDLKAHHAPVAGCSRPHPREYHPATDAVAERPLSGRSGSKSGSGSSTHGRACTQRVRGQTPSPRCTASGCKSGDKGKKHKPRYGKHHWTSARKVVKRRRLSGWPPTPPVPVRRGQGQFAFSEADEFYIEDLMWWVMKQNAETGLSDISKLAGDAASHHSTESWLWFLTRSKRSEHLKEVMKEARDEYSTQKVKFKREGEDERRTSRLERENEDSRDYGDSDAAESDDDRSDESESSQSDYGAYRLPLADWVDPTLAEQMGGFRDPYGEVEIQMMARYIAFMSDKWGNFETQEGKMEEFQYQHEEQSKSQSDGQDATRPDTRDNMSRSKSPIDLTGSSPLPLPRSSDETVI
ncbi:hypothetical protein EIP86_011296 [Pleurotus ostreatoroseus]|nr:hypothetical protein EIP86_011296 [Pleurotus ostreatoroseus]